MKTSRRAFFRQTLAVGPVAMTFWLETDSLMAQGGPECTLPNPGAPKQFVPNEKNVVERISAAEMADSSRATQLQRFREAIGLIRNLPPANPKNIPPDDVRSWTKQIATHCINCARPNPNNIHYSQMFLPWHRGLLYFLERILRTQSGYDDLRLPYWDWENSNSRTLPSIYVPEGQSLFWGNRNLSGPLSDDDVDVQGLLGVPTFDDFGGTARLGRPTPASFSGPHANVHDAFAPGDMADLQYSPRDPVFYAHHGNIDRLWSSWVNVPHSNPDFGKTARVLFYDENKTWRFVLLNDLREEAPLGYKYSSLMKSEAAGTHPTLFSLQKSGPKFSVASAGLATLKSKPAGPRYLLLRNIQNLEKLGAEAVRYGIFAGAPTAGTQAAADEGYLGKASRVASSGHNHAGPLTAVLNVTAKISLLLRDKKAPLDLTIAPLDASGKTSAPGTPLVADNVSIIG
jgi:polyphenol oxidase